MTIICEPDAERAAAIASTVGGPVAVVDTLVDAAIALAAGSEPPVVVGGAADAGAVASFTTELRSTNADAVVVVLRPGLDDLVEQMTAAGVMRPERDQQRADDASGPAGDAHTPLGNVITVYSAKGGTGTTTVAVNLAAALAAGAAGTVCLVDLDLCSGDVAIALQLIPHRTVADASAGPVDAEVERLITAAERVGVDCVLAPVEPARGEDVSVAVVGQLLEILRARYDHIVVDTSVQLSEAVLAALDVSDHHVLVTAPDVAAVKALRLTLDVFDLLGYPAERRTVVLNRAGAAHALTADEVEQALGRRPAVQVPDTDEAVEALNRGEPLVATARANPAATAIKQLSTRVGGTVPTPARQARRGLRWRKR